MQHKRYSGRLGSFVHLTHLRACSTSICILLCPSPMCNGFHIFLIGLVLSLDPVVALEYGPFSLWHDECECLPPVPEFQPPDHNFNYMISCQHRPTCHVHV